MNEQSEPILTDAGKAYVQDVLAAAKSPRASDSIKRIAEVMQRFVWLEAERERLTESDQPNDYYIYGNVKVQERAYYLITELGGKLEAAESKIEELTVENRTLLAKLAIARQMLVPFQDELARMGIV